MFSKCHFLSFLDCPLELIVSHYFQSFSHYFKIIIKEREYTLRMLIMTVVLNHYSHVADRRHIPVLHRSYPVLQVEKRTGVSPGPSELDSGCMCGFTFSLFMTGSTELRFAVILPVLEV